jgi:phosphate-selective porin OprO/OprP
VNGKAYCITLLAIFSFAPHCIAQDQDATPQQSEQEAPAQTPPEWRFEWDNRPSVRYGDLVRIDARARFTTDLRQSGASLGDSDTSRFDIARRRVGISGEIRRVADFQVERELAGEGRWRDLYLDYRGFDGVNVQAGQFKLPFGLDENTSSTNLDFVYRSRAAALSPGRDPGVMAHGRVRTLQYEAGVFTRDGDNGLDDYTRRATSWTPAGRLVLQPFRASESVLEDLQAGIAFTSSEVPLSFADLRGPSAVGQPFFRQEFGVQGMRRRVGVEMRWRPGPYSVQSEFVRLTSERRGQSVTDADLPPLVAAAWYVSGTWIVTGEEKARGADEPNRPLFAGGFGSVEFAARVEAVRFSSSGDGPPTFGPRAEAMLHRDRAVTLGVNWSPNRWIRLQANLVRDTMTVPDGGMDPSEPLALSSFWSRVVRLRFAM